MNETTALPAPACLTPFDYAPVMRLIEETRRRRDIAQAIVTWQNAVTVFKQTELDIGLPNDDDRDGYLAIVCDLRASGYHLLRLAAAHDIDLEKESGITRQAMRSIIAELELNERCELMPDDPDATRKIAAYFAEK